MDLSSLSDDQLKSLYSQKSLASMSDEELKAAYHGPGVGDIAKDVAVQSGVGLAKGIEAIPAAMPSLMGLAGKGVQHLMDNYAPGMSDPQAVANNAKVLELGAQAAKAGGGPGLERYYPKPQTGYGEAAQYATAAVPSMLGMPGGAVTNTIGGMASGLGAYGAGQLAPTPESKPYFEAAGGLVAGTAGLKKAANTEQRIAAGFSPTNEQVYRASRGGYESANAQMLGEKLPKGYTKVVADEARDTLNSTGNLREARTAGAHGAINTLENSAGKDVVDLANYRQNLRELVNSGGPDSAAAAKLLPIVENEMETLSPGAVSKLRKAEKDWSIFRAGEAVTGKIEGAEQAAGGVGSGLNRGQKIKQAINNYLNSSASEHLSPTARAELERAGKGSLTQRGLHAISAALGGGGGMWTGALALGSLGGAYFDPRAAFAVPIGIGSRLLSNSMAANRARIAGALARSESSVGNKSLMKIKPTLSQRRAALAAALAGTRVGAIENR